MEFPGGIEHAEELVEESLGGDALFPPVFGVEIAVGSGGDGDGDGRREAVLENVEGTAGVIVGSDQDERSPTALLGEMKDGERFVEGAVRILGKLQDFVFGDAAFGEVVFDEFGFAGIGTKAFATGNHDGRSALAVELGGVGGAVGVEVVTAENDDGVGVLGGLIDDPGFGRETHDGAAGEVDGKAEDGEEEERDEGADDAAALRATLRGRAHELRSMERRCSAACSGRMPLKYTSLML